MRPAAVRKTLAPIIPMTTPEINIHLAGTSGLLHKIRDINSELETEFKVRQSTFERFSGADGSQTQEFLKIIIEVKLGLTDFVKTYVKDKIFEFAFETGILYPFYRWLKKVDALELRDAPREIEYKFDDITIKIGYTKSNHINGLGLVCGKIPVIREVLAQQGLKDISVIATPMTMRNNQWFFFSPDKNFPLTSYLDHLGIEINKSNRFILNTLDGKVIFQHWW
jgi:hypothetical protein